MRETGQLLDMQKARSVVGNGEWSDVHVMEEVLGADSALVRLRDGGGQGEGHDYRGERTHT